jgi:hypothetical protein
MNRTVLQQRLDELGWKPYRLAIELDKLRGEDKGAANYASTVKKGLNNPDSCMAKTLEDLVKAMGGEIFIRWQKTEEIIVDYEEVKLSK